MAETNLFKWGHYESEIILLCVRWYLRYALSYRDLEEMMEERNITVDHTTIYRWVQRYAVADHVKLHEFEHRRPSLLRPLADNPSDFVSPETSSLECGEFASQVLDVLS